MLDADRGVAGWCVGGTADHTVSRPRDSVHAHLVLLLGAVVSCGANYCTNRTKLEVCLQEIYSIFENDQHIGLPTTKQELELMCKTFHTGMTCVDEYAKECLTIPERTYLDQMVLGPRITMHQFCYNKHFQKEYLEHAPCYDSIRKELEGCSESMKEIVNFYRINKGVANADEVKKHICCAKHDFLKCTNEVTKCKCNESATILMRKISESVSGPEFMGECPTQDPCSCKNVSGVFKTVSAPSARSPAHRPRPLLSLTTLCIVAYALLMSASYQ